MDESVTDKRNSNTFEILNIDPHLPPRPIPIVLTEQKHVFTLDEEALEQILLDDNVKDCNAVVVSVAGAFRKGKSFLLDFFLRYMNHTYGSSKSVGDSWIGDVNIPLEGFSWRGGSERDTTGILMWSEIFRTTTPSGEKVAVILLDTQGTFDSESTVRDNATVFALSTMLSSIQIYNLTSNIQEDDLQHLQLFTEYGRLALEDSGTKPFQKLEFLVRDWSFPYEAEFGAKGGKQILNKRLAISENQHPELESLRKHIKSCFTDIGCYLMPHPGLKVATNPKFDGRLAEIEPDFIQYLSHLVPLLLAPENLVQKEISGQKVKVKELVQYFKSYMKLFSGDDLPEPKSMLVATAEANNLSAVAAAKELYHQLMESVCGGTRPFMSSDQLEGEHLRCKDAAMEQFQAKRKMGGDEFSASYRSKLELDIEEEFNQFRAHNESKNIFKAARTPAVFITVVVFFYIFSGIAAMLGINSLYVVSNVAMIFTLLTLVVWVYIRYSGEMCEYGETFDLAANILWEHIMKPIYELCVRQSMEQIAKGATNQMIQNKQGPSLNRASSRYFQRSISQTSVQNGKVKNNS